MNVDDSCEAAARRSEGGPRLSHGTPDADPLVPAVTNVMLHPTSPAVSAVTGNNLPTNSMQIRTFLLARISLTTTASLLAILSSKLLEATKIRYTPRWLMICLSGAKMQGCYRADGLHHHPQAQDCHETVVPHREPTHIKGLPVRHGLLSCRHSHQICTH